MDSSGCPARLRYLSPRLCLISSTLSISGYYYHFCAKLSDGRARCWGNNRSGQLGNGNADSAADPVENPVDVLLD